MLKKRNLLVLVCIFIVVFFSGCTAPIQKVGMVKQLNNKNVGVITGTAADTMVLDLTKNANIVYFDKVSESVKALKEDKIDAVVYDEPALKIIAANYNSYTVLSELINNESYALAVKTENKELLKQINNVITTIKKDETYEEMINRWIPETGKSGEMPKIALSDENGILTFGTATTRYPFSYIIDNEYQGFDIELAKRIAKSMGKDLKIVNMEYDKLIPTLISGEVDFIGAGLVIKEEQENNISYSKSIYEGGNAVLVKKQ